MHNITFDRTIEFIFKSCITRVSLRLNEKKKKQIFIYPSNKSLVSHFFNYKYQNRNANNYNKYLVTPTLLDSTDESGDKTGIVNKLEFQDIHEVLWGNDNEFNENLFSIFTLLILDILEVSTEESAYLEYILCDNITYSMYSAFYKIKKSKDISLLNHFAIRDSMVDDSHMLQYLKSAIAYLYNKEDFNNKFKEIFLNFTELFNDFTHINDRLYKHFLPKFISLLNEYEPKKSSFGIRVKTIIETDIIKMLDQIDALKNNTDFLSSREFEMNKKIINAASSYIMKLEEIAELSKKYGIYEYGW